MPPRRQGVRESQRSSDSSVEFFTFSREGAHRQGSSMGSDKTSKSNAAISQTLQNVRQRILGELKESKSARGKMLQAHRQHAWEMAFGQPGGDEIEVSTIEISLICPYSRVALVHPVRSKDCQHLQCCDLDSWIALFDKYRSMRDPRAPCPVCEKRVTASSLELDYWQLYVLSQMPPGTHMLVLDPDGSYRSGDASREQKKQEAMEIIDSTQVDKEENVDYMSVVPSPDSVRSASMTCDARLSHVKRERHSEDAPVPPHLPDFPTASSPPTQDEDVFVVRYAAATAKTRALPSQARLWTAHCPRCARALLKSERGEMEGCTECGVRREDWTLVRNFPGSPLSLELTGDGTLILRGADALAPHLARAGFFRAIFVDSEDGECPRKDSGIWYTTASLTRYELDFLEACCQRLACGETVAEMPSVPALFRIPRKRFIQRESMFTQFSHTSLSG